MQLWYNKQRPKKNGKVSLYIQLLVNGQHDQVSLNLEWPLDKIDWSRKALKPRSAVDEDLITYNAIIERERNKYWSVVMRFLKDERSFDLKDVYREINLYGSGNLVCDFMKNAIKERLRTTNSRERIKFSSSKSHQVTLKWLKEYLNEVDIPLTHIDGDWLQRFADYLRDYMCENTVWVRIKDVKAYLNYAFRNKLAINQDYKRFSITMDESDPTWLEEHELNALLVLYDNPDISDVTRRNLKAFLFACFTGLRISDLKRWNKNWIVDDIISFVPEKRRLSKKTPKPLNIPIIPIARQFINDLSTDTFDLPDDHVYNREIKSMAADAGITKNITSHVARHTFATWLAIDQVPEIVISKLLGHKSLSTTRIYMHIADRHKAIEMMKMQRRFGLGR